MAVYRTPKQYADLARDPKYDKLTYSQYDCQAYCELVLKDLGIRKSDGAIYNWKGSNDMARNACSWIGTKEECIKQFGSIPAGAWAFIWDNTGNEKKRGYFDGLGNFCHIGIYVGSDIVRDSTIIKSGSKIVRDGIGNRPLSAFNRIGFCKLLDFNGETPYNKNEEIVKNISSIRKMLDDIERMVNE